jgi:hypothetical protein
LASLSDPVSFLYCVSRTTTRIFLDNFKHRKYLQQDDHRDLREVVMREYNLHKYMRMALVLVPECHPQRGEWEGFVEKMREILTE